MKRKHLFQIVLAVALLSAALAVAGCGTTTAQSPTETPVDTVKYQMGWVHEYSSTPFYMAIANGHYAKEHLDIELSTGGFSESGYIDPIEQVVSGAAEFSQTSLFALLQAREQGKPVVAIATLNQRSPFAIISLRENGIVRPEDLVGKTVAIAEGGAELNYDALLGVQDIDPQAINTVPRSSFGIEPLLKGEVDAFGGWIINEGVALEESGADPHYILLSDYGIDIYDLLIFTTEDMIANHPDKVERFLRASLAGLQDVIDNPEKAIDVALTYDPNLVKEEQLNRLRAFIPLIHPAGTQLGMMQPDVWQFNYQLLLDNQVLSSEQDISKAYSLDFLNNIYSAQQPAA